MKKFLIFTILFNTVLFSSSNTNKQEKRTDKHIQKAIEKEKKYAKEQTFYMQKDYDLKSAEINPDSLSSIPNIEPDNDFDMDDVY
ncbi:hypothetical protein [Sulfurimonas lithotrophica]|nr:hypothetical protein [Sulfurimonas lithotrophica]